MRTGGALYLLAVLARGRFCTVRRGGSFAAAEGTLDTLLEMCEEVQRIWGSDVGA